MMKLYRPLCSDVTMRLAVDISPDDDDCDDVTDQFRRASSACDNSEMADKAHLPAGRQFSSPSSSTSSSTVSSANSSAASSPFHTRSRNQMESDSANHNLSNTSRRSDNLRYQAQHSSSSTNRYSWYSRQNTTDKTAKDIYNHEHGHETTTTDYQRVPLDPEFKRAIEEDGNDYKEVSLYDELNTGTSLYRELETNGNFQNRDSSTNNQYSSAGSSPRRVKGQRTGTNLNKRGSDKLTEKTGDAEVNDNDYDDVGNKRRRHGTPNGSSDEEDVDVDNVDGHDDDDDEDDDDGDDDETTFEQFDACHMSTHEELPIDLDEDVDVIDKQVIMSQSMLTSFYGEIDEEELQKSMTQSMQVDEIPDEMSKSIAEEIHDVLLGDDADTKTDDVFNTKEPQAQQLPFPYPFTLKHAGHLFDKSRHYFTASPPPTPSHNRSRHSSSTSRSTLEDIGTNCSPRTTRFSTSDRSDSLLEPVASAERSATPREPTPGTSPAPSYPSSPARKASSSSASSYQSSPSHKPSPASTIQACPSQKSSSSSSSTTTPPVSQPKKCSVATLTMVSHLDLEVTHRGLHRFIPRHKDEMNIGIGDPIHVLKECDDLWCEGINLRTGERGIFPAMYANDLNFLEESDEEEEYWKFNMRFLGSVEVTSHKGDETLVTAINKVAMTYKGNVMTASLSTLEINQYGIRMIDKSKEGHEKDAFSHFFALKNISFCGTHPKNNRYFAFITKHPRDYKFACHVFHGDRPTHRARDALGEAFKRFYQEYMAFTHPTEDIYME